MKNLGRLVCHIPARMGSKRVPRKNMRYIQDKPLIAYAIECAKNADIFDEIYVNTDSKELCSLAEAYAVKGYLRNAWLASDEAKGDDFTADIMENVEMDTLLMINPVCPLIRATDIKNAVEAYQNSACDTLISCEETQMQVFCEGKGVNIDDNAALEPTQNNPKVQILNWAVSIWDRKTFLNTYRNSQKGYLGTNRLLFPIPSDRTVKISNEVDFQLADRLITARSVKDKDFSNPRYWNSNDLVS